MKTQILVESVLFACAVVALHPRQQQVSALGDPVPVPPGLPTSAPAPVSEPPVSVAPPVSAVPPVSAAPGSPSGGGSGGAGSGSGGGKVKCGQGYTYCGRSLRNGDHEYTPSQLAQVYCRDLPENCQDGAPVTKLDDALFVCETKDSPDIALLCACDGECLERKENNYIAKCQKACVNAKAK